MLLFYILVHLAGSLVAFDTTTENYTVPVSGKCVLTCYVAEVRSFKVSHSFISSIQNISIITSLSFFFFLYVYVYCNMVCWPDAIVLFVGSTNFCVYVDNQHL
jgi:hypothetical protein